MIQRIANLILYIRFELAKMKYRNPACILCYKVVHVNYRLINPPFGYGRREVRVCENCWPKWQVDRTI